MLLDKREFKLATMERNSVGKVKSDSHILQHNQHAIQLHVSPTYNCQMAIIGGINSLINCSSNKDEIIQNLKTVLELIPKRIVMVDLKCKSRTTSFGHHYGDILDVCDEFTKILPEESIISSNRYTSTNESEMCIMLLKTELIKNLD